MSGTTTAIVVLVAVGMVVGGILLWQRSQRRAARLDPGQQIAAGVGNIVGGIIGLATDSGGGGSGAK